MILWTCIVGLIILWLIGYGFHVAGPLIHVLLILALVFLVIQIMMPKRTA